MTNLRIGRGCYGVFGQRLVGYIACSNSSTRLDPDVVHHVLGPFLPEELVHIRTEAFEIFGGRHRSGKAEASGRIVDGDQFLVSRY